MVTDRIVEQMQQGIIPWLKPWHLAGTEEEVAVNYVTRRPYSLVNQWLLMEPGEYLTFKQIKDLKGNIKKGAKSRFVVFYTKYEFEAEDENTGEKVKKSIPILRYYNVFRLADTEGIPSKIQRDENGEVAVKEVARCAEADAAIDAYVASQTGLTFTNNRPSDRAFYSPVDDCVVVPMPEQFDDPAEYYSTAFHELTHSTLIEARCNRRDAGKVAFFGSKEYSREELVAEIGAAMLCSNFDMDTKKAFRNSIAYLQSWASKLKDDPKAVVVAAGKAEKAARFILGERN